MPAINQLQAITVFKNGWTRTVDWVKGLIRGMPGDVAARARI